MKHIVSLRAVVMALSSGTGGVRRNRRIRRRRSIQSCVLLSHCRGEAHARLAALAGS